MFLVLWPKPVIKSSVVTFFIVMLDTFIIMISRRLITTFNYSTKLLYKEIKTSNLVFKTPKKHMPSKTTDQACLTCFTNSFCP